jgi:16S rRNA processing protein RimM
VANDITQKARELRKNSTEAEKLLWRYIRNRGLNGAKFKRQYSIPPYILDFFCEEHGLAIELDGGQHNDPAHIKYDRERTDFLKKSGVVTIRFWNNDVLENIEGVLETIRQNIPSPSHATHGSPPLPREREILIGEITTAHGIKGDVKIRSYVEDFRLFENCFSEDGKNFILKIKNNLVAKVKGITDRNEAEKLRGTRLYIDRDLLPKPEEGEFYIEDLKGMKVIDANGKEIGVVADVRNYGAGDLLDIKPPVGDSFYALFDHVTNVDMDERTVTINPPEEI